jgi:serine/threonine protein kinase
MYEMLTGKVPFDGDNPVSVALKHINEEIVPPSALVKGIPPRIEQIVMKANSKIDYRLELDRHFPDRIRVLSTELQQDGKNQPAAWQHKPPIPVKIHQN